MCEKEHLSKAEMKESRRLTALNNIETFGVQLPKRCYLNGRLTDNAVNRLEKLAPGFTIVLCISPNIIGIGYLSSSIVNLKKIKGTVISTPIKAYC